MDLAALLARTVEDLEQRLGGDVDDYAMLRASALLRQLLLDRYPLAFKAAKQIRHKIRFDVSAVGVTAPTVSEPVMRFSNVNAFDGPTVTLNKDEFLARKIVSVGGEDYSVREVIRVVAHVHGGVHYFDPETEREERLMTADSFITVNDMAILHNAVQGIGVSVVEALRPLVAKMRARAGSFPDAR